MKKCRYNYLDDSFFKRRFKNNSVSLNIFTENEESQKIVTDLQSRRFKCLKEVSFNTVSVARNTCYLTDLKSLAFIVFEF